MEDLNKFTLVGKKKRRFHGATDLCPYNSARMFLQRLTTLRASARSVCISVSIYRMLRVGVSIDTMILKSFLLPSTISPTAIRKFLFISSVILSFLTCMPQF